MMGSVCCRVRARPDSTTMKHTINKLINMKSHCQRARICTKGEKISAYAV